MAVTNYEWADPEVRARLEAADTATDTAQTALRAAEAAYGESIENRRALYHSERTKAGVAARNAGGELI